ncbi:hypothetical protein [Streptomyces sp. NPDC019890]|uniref:hypothetical protein n=1 Tax=Streptomyces sp. NPDC019890 TaxID=3365064 RepID=UPI00384F7B5D
MSEPPVPPNDRPAAPDSDESAPIADMREKFARESDRVARDPEAERAFLQNKIEIIRSHPTLSAAEKEEAVAPLLQQLRQLDDETGRKHT